MKKILVFSYLVISSSAFCQIAAWDFTGESTVATSTAEFYNANLDASSTLTRGAGALASAGANSFRTQGFQNNGIALTNTDYFENTFSAAPGFTLSLTSINARFAGTATYYANTGVTMQFAYSLDGTNFTLISSPFSMTAIGTMPTIDLSGISSLQNVADNITVTIRFYASGQTATGGWGYNSPSSGSYGLAFGGTLNCATQTTFYSDADGDTFGDANSTILACSQPAGYVSNSTDCNDANAAINPNTIWYSDADGDLFGNVLVSQTSCTQPTGYVQNATDCDDANSNVNASGTFYQDLDQDGFGNVNVSISNCGQPAGYVLNSTDCNDTIASINPSATEIADNIDNDCDGLTDEGFAILTWILDTDQDGFGGNDTILAILSPGINYVLIGGDCNDSLATTNPNAPEICDGIDNNCNGSTDENLPLLTYYADIDGDTYGNNTDSLIACSQPTGYVLNNTDCDDTNPSVNPGATDIPVNGIDEDCNGVDAPLVPVSLGIYQFTGTTDCATQDNLASNSNIDLTFSNFNGVGTNCAAGGGIFNRSAWNTTTTVDLNQYNEFSVNAANCQSLNLDRVAFKYRPSASAGSPVWHLRSSIDNFAADLDFGTGINVGNAYLDDTVYLSNHSNLTQVTFRFYVTEMLGTTTTWRMDDVSLYGNILAVTPQTYYADVDGDGYGDFLSDSLTCSTPIGFVSDSTDCNDLDSLINPSTTWYADTDNDLIGDSSMSYTGCIPPTGYVLAAGDCDDMNTQISGPITYYSDMDSDSYGDLATAQVLCQNPGAGFVIVAGDCNDNNALINPVATEICDGVDNDCDGVVDDSLVFAMYYVDADGDGFGDEATGVEQCSQPQNTITTGGDCDDANDQIYPGATEVCDGFDNDCDGGTDEGLNFITYYTDADNDGFGIGSTGSSFCENPGLGFSTNNSDCDDANGLINTSATEILDNGIDENCDGVDGYLGITENNLLDVQLIPNPSNGLFEIKLNSHSTGTIVVTDLHGKTVKKLSYTGDKIAIDASELINGTYLIKIETNSLIQIVRFVKI